MGVRWICVLCSFVSIACSDEAPRPPASPGPPPATPPQPGSAAATEEAQPLPQGPPINLLSSVRAAVAVSSVYEDRPALAGKLVDGALETAWNSRSGDLVGAWIEVRLPDGVTVGSVEMSAGFTREGGRTDLFTGNHRVSRVRVLHDGAEVGVFALDTASRELQTLPVRGGGGVYRIEIAEVLPGSRDDWREVCVSELRVMGWAEGASGGQMRPRVAVGVLPEVGSDSAPTQLAGAPSAHHDSEFFWFWVEWSAYERDLIGAELGAGASAESQVEAVAPATRRARLYERLASLLDPVDAARATALRDGFGTVSDFRWTIRRADLDEAAAVMQAVVDARDDAASGCDWATTLASVRLDRVNSLAGAEWHRLEHIADELSSSENTGATERAYRASEAVYRSAEAIEAQLDAFLEDPRAAARRLQGLRAPRIPHVQPEWDAMKEQLDVARSACGWGG